MLLFFLYYIFGLHFPLAVIRVTDFFIHTIKFIRHKFKKKVSSVEDLPLRPIIFNVGTASYQLAKYLAKLLSPLSKSQYTLKRNY